VGFLAERKVATTRTSPNDVHLDLDPGYGLNLFLTDRTIPGDTRA
jgi:hypothetical protein